MRTRSIATATAGIIVGFVAVAPTQAKHIATTTVGMVKEAIELLTMDHVYPPTQQHLGLSTPHIDMEEKQWIEQ